MLSTQKKLANTIDKVEKQSEALEKSGDNSTDVFSRYFISNYLRDAKTANDFSDNEKLEKMVYLVRHRQVALCYFLRKKRR